MTYLSSAPLRQFSAPDVTDLGAFALGRRIASGAFQGTPAKEEARWNHRESHLQIQPFPRRVVVDIVTSSSSTSLTFPSWVIQRHASRRCLPLPPSYPFLVSSLSPLASFRSPTPSIPTLLLHLLSSIATLTINSCHLHLGTHRLRALLFPSSFPFSFPTSLSSTSTLTVSALSSPHPPFLPLSSVSHLHRARQSRRARERRSQEAKPFCRKERKGKGKKGKEERKKRKEGKKEKKGKKKGRKGRKE